MARFGVARRAGERGPLTRLVIAKQPIPVHIHTSRLQEDAPFKKTAEGLGMDPKEPLIHRRKRTFLYTAKNEKASSPLTIVTTTF